MKRIGIPVALAAAAILAACGQDRHGQVYYPDPAPQYRAPPSAYRPAPPRVPPAVSAEQYPPIAPSWFQRVDTEPISTFSIDVDTTAYSHVRRHLQLGQLPPRDAVRIEELINYFSYAYPGPRDAMEPFAMHANVYPAPWAPDRLLLHIGIKGYDMPRYHRPNAHIVLLVDVSGSMQDANRLPMLRRAFGILLDELHDEDRVSIVTYSGHSRVALRPTPVSERERIETAIQRLSARGSTAGAAGLSAAYDLAERHFDYEGINRIILATDGDFNVGPSDPQHLEWMISQKRDSGIYLSVVTVGEGNVNDRIAQALAQKGNGNAAHFDTLLEARKVFGDDFSSTMFPIADDAKIQIEFNPARVAAYRLLGYETREMAHYEFRDDRADAGDIGAGHTVTAIYEITPTGAGYAHVEQPRYQPHPAEFVPGDAAHEFAFLRLRYKRPGGERSQLIELPIDDSMRHYDIASLSSEVRFATAVAGFGLMLRNDGYTERYGFSSLLSLAEGARAADRYGYRAEFIRLLQLAQTLKRS